MNLSASSDTVTPLDEQAYQQLRQALVEGVFAPGDKLSIRRIASALGTSPMPARTALRRLAAEQAVDVLPSGTAIVPRLTRTAFLELGAIRAELEPLAVRLAAPRMNAEILARLEMLLATHKAAREQGKPEEYLRMDREFLFTLYRQANAPMLLGMIEALWLRRGPLFWEARWVLLGRGSMPHRHKEMLVALREGDGVRAADDLRMEIASATTFLLEQLRFQGDMPVGNDLGLPGLRGSGR